MRNPILFFVFPCLVVLFLLIQLQGKVIRLISGIFRVLTPDTQSDVSSIEAQDRPGLQLRIHRGGFLEFVVQLHGLASLSFSQCGVHAADHHSRPIERHEDHCAGFPLRLFRRCIAQQSELGRRRASHRISIYRELIQHGSGASEQFCRAGQSRFRAGADRMGIRISQRSQYGHRYHGCAQRSRLQAM